MIDTTTPGLLFFIQERINYFMYDTKYEFQFWAHVLLVSTSGSNIVHTAIWKFEMFNNNFVWFPTS